MALDTVRAIPGAELMSEADYPAHASRIAKAGAWLFYMDDDDIFAPDLRVRLANIDLGRLDIAVFPLVRLAQTSYTFVRADEPADTVVGARRDFDFRFQTNNYAISAGRVSSDHVPHLQDHVLASAYADRWGLNDAYFDRIVSATNKTPCSASGLPSLLRRPDDAVGLIGFYVEALRALPIPRSEAWLREPLARTTDLFDRLIASARPGPRLGMARLFKLRFGL